MGISRKLQLFAYLDKHIHNAMILNLLGYHRGTDLRSQKAFRVYREGADF
jgi:hypothetical protein